MYLLSRHKLGDPLLVPSWHYSINESKMYHKAVVSSSYSLFYLFCFFTNILYVKTGKLPWKINSIN